MAWKIPSLVSLSLLAILAMILPLRFNQVKQRDGNSDEKRVQAPKKPEVETKIEPGDMTPRGRGCRTTPVRRPIPIKETQP